jgi:hypothetical protein
MTTETNDADWKWDGKVINGFAKFNRLVKQDCTMRRLTSALEEPPGYPEPPGPTAFIFAGNPSGLYTAQTKHQELLKSRKEDFEQVIAIIFARLDTVPAQRVQPIASIAGMPVKNKIAVIFQTLEQQFAGDNIIQKTKVERKMKELPNGNDATSVESLLNELTILNAALRTMHLAYALPDEELIGLVIKKLLAAEYQNLRDQIIEASLDHNYTWAQCCGKIRRTIETKIAFCNDPAVDYSAGSATHQQSFKSDQAERDRQYGEQARLAASASEYGRRYDKDERDFDSRDRGRRDRSNSEPRGYRGRSRDRKDQDYRRDHSRDKSEDRSRSNSRGRYRDRSDYSGRYNGRRREEPHEDYNAEERTSAKFRYETSKRANSAKKETRPDSPHPSKDVTSSNAVCW